MFLQHEKMANQKLAIGKGEVISCDAKGICEVKSEEVAQSLIASGFIQMEEKKAAKKPEPIAEEPKEEIEQPKEEPKAEKPSNRKWQRSR